MKLEKHSKGYRAKGTTTKENYKSKHKMIGPKGNNEFCSLRSIDGLEGAKLTFSFGTSHIQSLKMNQAATILFSRRQPIRYIIMHVQSSPNIVIYHFPVINCDFP